MNKTVVVLVALWATLALPLAANEIPDDFLLSQEDLKAAGEIAMPLLPAFKRSQCHVAVEYDLEEESRHFDMFLYQGWRWFSVKVHPELVLYSANNDFTNSPRKRQHYVLSNRCDEKSHIMKEFVATMTARGLWWGNPKVITDNLFIDDNYDKEYAKKLYIPESN